MALSRALSNLSRKGLIMKYAEIDPYDEWKVGDEKFLYQSYQPLHKSRLRGPQVNVFLGLSEMGGKELRKRD